MWVVLHEHGAGWRKKEGTKRYWETLSEKEQAHAYTTITEKLADGRFVHYDPIQAIKDTLWSMVESQQETEPTNYKGRALPAGKIIVSARYKDAWGSYELEEAEAHGMPIRYPDHILIRNREIIEKINNHVDWVQVKVPYMPEDFVFCTRANAEKYHIEIIADPRNYAANGDNNIAEVHDEGAADDIRLEYKEK